MFSHDFVLVFFLVSASICFVFVSVFVFVFVFPVVCRKVKAGRRHWRRQSFSRDFVFVFFPLCICIGICVCICVSWCQGWQEALEVSEVQS